MVIHAIYENGVFRPLDPVELPEGRRVDVIISASPDEVQAGSPSESTQAEESRLLEEINRGLSTTDWTRYHALIAKRRQEIINYDELDELTALADRLAELGAARLERLDGLARLRSKPLPQWMDDRGITAPAVL